MLITADDMNWDAVGAFGCPTPGTTPNIDRLAAGGLRFNHGHVTIAVCQPSRSALMTGRYPKRFRFALNRMSHRLDVREFEQLQKLSRDRKIENSGIFEDRFEEICWTKDPAEKRELVRRMLRHM